MESPASSQPTVISETFDEFNTHLQAKALKATRAALSLPADVAFHRSMDSGFSRDLDVFSSSVLSLTNKLLGLVATADATHSTRTKGKAKLENQDDVVDNFHSLVVDSVDQLLERTDMCLDQYLGRTKASAVAVNPPLQKKKLAPRGQLDPVIQHASHLKKPQLLFKRKVENDDLPWHPTLSHKYHAKVPLGYEYHDSDVDLAGDSHLISSHPYRYEITHISYPQTMYDNTIPTPPKDFKDTPFTWVATPHDLRSMLAKLRRSPDIAVDLEHHSYRSFTGFLCLMQISTRDEDWIIDTLSLREELEDLNEVFTNPKIVKVFHGADHDIVWLQQNFNIYVVNLFDTYHASKLLDFPRHGLANLLEMYCDFIPDKRYQLADWRIRPLPEEMLQYARSDTHFLLYIYDNLRNALLDRAASRAQSRAQSPSASTPNSSSSGNAAHELIKQVLARSEETALRLYEKEVYDEESGSGSNGWDTLARKWNKGALMAGGPDAGVVALQKAVYKAVHKWRDTIAREDDESHRYVLPNHFLFQLAEQPPADMAALFKVFPSVPPVIRKRAKGLLDVIRARITSHLSGVSTPPASTSQGSAFMLTDEAENIITAPKVDAAPSRLWNHDRSQGPTNTSASTSALFGTTLPPTSNSAHDSASFTKSRSSLFGNMIRMSSVCTSRRDNSHFRELVARINSTLFIMPSMPKLAVKEITQDSNAIEDASLQGPVLGTEVEIPFVPASQRKPTQVVEDSIVVVGQARQRKRKRTKAVVEDVDALRSADGLNGKKAPDERSNVTSQIEATGDEEESFDFSTVPNILDNNPDPEASSVKKKKRKQKHGEMFYGDFPAPPKAYSEPKRGNQSHTFK